MFTAGEKDDWS